MDLPSYTLRTDDVQLSLQETKRYTMRDIGQIERRVQNVEYYTQLSLLEIQIQIVTNSRL